MRAGGLLLTVNQELLASLFVADILKASSFSRLAVSLGMCNIFNFFLC